MEPPRFSDRVFDVVRRIPRGRVASYGLVAELAGSPRSARHVGMVMRFAIDAPWHRVVAKEGRIAIMNPELRREQVDRLAAEGIDTDARGYVDYERFAWRPRPSRQNRPSTD